MTPGGDVDLVVSQLLAINAALPANRLHVFGKQDADFSLEPNALPEQAALLYQLLRVPTDSISPTDALISILRQHGLTNSRIGIEMDGLTPNAQAELRQKLPGAVLMDCSN